METQQAYNIYFDTKIDTVIMEWDGYSTSRQFKEGTEFMLNTLIKSNAYKVLADIKNMTLIGMEDQQWLETDFIPRAIHWGFRAIALVRPDNYFNNVAVESVSFKVDKEKLQINFFDNTAAARRWLATL